MRRFRLTAIALLAALASGGALAVGPSVKTASGPVAGVSENGADKFLGVPFAAPPIGALRWKPPQAPASWSEPRDASKHAMRCSAPSAGDGPRIVNEDCLYLDVYRPAGVASDARLPVTVFIHGGGNYSGSTDIYDGGRMAAEGRTIVVTPAYRLGAFGYLAHPALTAEGAGAGDFGLLDQIKALQWVHDNIAAFGGDPAHVMLAGESSGGTAVCSLMASPAANGLYERVAVQSGVCQVNPDLAGAEKAGEAFAAKLGCHDAACLRAKPAAAVLDAWPATVTGPAYGTKTLPVAPMHAFATGAFDHVPALIGFNRNEMFGFMHGLYPLSEAAYEKMVKQKFPAQADELLKRYPASKYPHVEYAFGGIQGDSFLVCHAFRLADLISKYAPVAMYEFADMTVPNWKSLGDAQKTPPGYHVGAGHTSELPYLLNYAAIEKPLDADQLKLAATMIHMWVGFGPEDKAWTPYSAAGRKVTVLQLPAAGGIVVSSGAYKAHNCDFWNKGS